MHISELEHLFELEMQVDYDHKARQFTAHFKGFPTILTKDGDPLECSASAPSIGGAIEAYTSILAGNILCVANYDHAHRFPIPSTLTGEGC